VGTLFSLIEAIKKAPAKKLRLMNIIFGCGGRI
jgi:hypothetical protein